MGHVSGIILVSFFEDFLRSLRSFGVSRLLLRCSFGRLFSRPEPGAARPRLHGGGGGSETDPPDTGDRRYLSTGAFAARELWPST